MHKETKNPDKEREIQTKNLKLVRTQRRPAWLQLRQEADEKIIKKMSA